MGAERRYKRQKDREVKKMYDREMRRMSTMTDQEKVRHLHYLSSKFEPNTNNQVEVIEPVNVDGN